MEIKQDFSYAVYLEALEVTKGEPIEVRVFVGYLAEKLILPPVIVLEIHIELGVHGIHFAVGLVFAH